VDEAIQDGVGKGWITDYIMPLIERELSGYDGGTETVAILYNFQEVMALFVSEFGKAPVIEDQEMGSSEAGKDFAIAPVPFGDVQFLKKTWDSKIMSGVALPTSLVCQGASEESFPAAGRAGNEHIVVMTDPGTGGELGHQRSVQPPGVAVVDILDSGGLPQFRLLEACLEMTVLSLGHFTVDHETQTFLEAQGVDLRHVDLLFKSLSHAGES